MRRSGDPWGGPHVEAALAQAEEIWTEVDVSFESEARAQTEAMRLGLSPGRALATYLDAADRQRLDALTARLGIPGERLSPMRPWMAALTLSVVPLFRAGYDPQAGVDRAVAAWGVQEGKTLRAFETAEEQIDFFAGLDEDVQVAMLREAVARAEEGVEVVNALSAAWDRGDIAVIEERTITELRTNYPRLYRSFFVQRNDDWMGDIARELEGAGVDFVAVGSGHVYGPDGLIAQLRARGVRVERVRAQ